MHVTGRGSHWRLRLRSLWHDARGQDLMEYALLAVLLAVTAAAVLSPSLPPTIHTMFSRVISVLAGIQ